MLIIFISHTGISPNHFYISYWTSALSLIFPYFWRPCILLSLQSSFLPVLPQPSWSVWSSTKYKGKCRSKYSMIVTQTGPHSVTFISDQESYVNILLYLMWQIILYFFGDSLPFPQNISGTLKPLHITDDFLEQRRMFSPACQYCSVWYYHPWSAPLSYWKQSPWLTKMRPLSLYPSDMGSGIPCDC